MSGTNDGRQLRESLSPEERLLLLTVRDDSPAAELGALLAQCDLTQLLHVAVVERATPILWRRIGPLVRDRARLEVQALERTARVSDFRLLLLEDRLATSLAALGALVTPPVLVKGAALAIATYPRFADRPMGDLDLLIDPAEASEATRLLGNAGWRSDASLDPEHYVHHHHLPRLIDGSGANLNIELHTNLFVDGHPFRFGPAEVRATAIAVPWRGRTPLVPSPVNQLLHCAVHYAWGHVMSEGAWRTFRDVEAIIARGEVDWDAFIAAASTARATTAAYWTLRLARTLADVPVPAAVERALRPSATGAVLSRIERHFALNVFVQRARCPSAWLSHTLWSAGMQPGRSGHGRARPWMWSDDFVPPAADPRASSREPVGRVRHEIERASRWALYIRRVLTGAASAAS
jgi:Uncharacterised nucleotidyltransferase